VKYPSNLILLVAGVLLLGGGATLAEDTPQPPDNLLFKGDIPAFGGPKVERHRIMHSFETEDPNQPSPILPPKDGGIYTRTATFDAGPAGLSRFPVRGALAGARGGTMSTPKYRADREIRKLIRRLG
jgi:hypothetical protein